jgi:predicted nucleotidyltransferase
MERYADLLAERAWIVRRWKDYMPSIVRAARALIPGARVYVFGSAIKGTTVGGSDVDILITSGKVPRSNADRAKLKVEIEEISGLPPYHPFEFHIADEDEAKWYLQRIKEIKEYTLDKNQG